MADIYYIDGNTLSNSTAIFTDSELTTCAPDGFYSDGVTSREQVSCILLPSQACGTCGTPCGEEIAVAGLQGIYLINSDAGGSEEDTGAILIKFNPASQPDGIRATFNGITYNKLSSGSDGYHASTSPTSHTFVGFNDTDPTSCAQTISGTTFPALPEYLYDGVDFVGTGNTQSLFIAAGDLSLSNLAPPGYCLMVIPKLTASPNIVNISVVGPCEGTSWDISIGCPVQLSGYSSSSTFGTIGAACSAIRTEVYYNAPQGGGFGTPSLYDWVFSDLNGQFILPDGYYGYGAVTQYMQVANGVIIALGTCP